MSPQNSEDDVILSFLYPTKVSVKRVLGLQLYLKRNPSTSIFL